MSELNQRHQLVLLFTDLTDSTRIAARLEPEHYAELLSQLRQHTNTIIARHGGEVVRVDGDGALCIFGYPLAHEDAGRRATEAALDLHAAVAGISHDAAVSMHSGIHAGVVLLRGGDLVRGRYEMLGDATNVAARLCDAAGPAGILVSAETLGADRHFFQTGPERAIALSGHGEPLASLPVLGRDGLPNRFATREVRGLSPFVGRAAERDALLHWLSSTGEAAPAMLVHGPAGIGKSRLLRVLSADFGERGWAIARGYCEGYLGAPTLQPMLQIAASLNPDFTPGHDLASQIESLIREHATRPLVLAIDDWQWADDASSGLIGRLMRESPSSLRVLLFSREPDPRLGPDGEYREVSLGPLEPSAARSTIERLLIAKDPFVVAQIESATGGSPLLIEELCHAYASNGRAAKATKLRGAWFDLSVQARFALLQPEDAQLLRLAAVIGNVIAPGLLAAICGRAIDAQILRRLQNADFLYPGDNGDTLRFKHGLTRDAVYASIGLAERRSLHARIADQYLEVAHSEGEAAAVDALAYHLAAAGRFGEALPFAVRAGDAALAAGALDRAQAHYQAAFGQIEQQPGLPDLIEKLRHVVKMFGRSCVIDPGREHVPELERMLAFAQTTGDGEAIALATYWIGAHYYGLGEPRRSLKMLELAYTQLATAGPKSFITQVEANLGQSHAIACQYEQAFRFMDRAIANKQTIWRPGQASSSLAYCQSSRGLVRADMGDFAAAHDDFDEALKWMAGAQAPILASLGTQRSLALNYQGRFEEAEREAIPAEAIARESRSRALVYFGKALANYARWRLSGEKHELDKLVEVAIHLKLIDQPQRISYIFGWIAEGMAQLQEEAASRLFAKLAFGCALKGDRLGEASAARALAVLAAQSTQSSGLRDFRKYLSMADRAARRRLSAREAALNQVCEANCLFWSGDQSAAQATAKAASTACAALALQASNFAFS